MTDPLAPPSNPAGPVPLPRPRGAPSNEMLIIAATAAVRPSSEPSSEPSVEPDPYLVCPNCGATMFERGCKLRCRCGYFLSCSDI